MTSEAEKHDLFVLAFRMKIFQPENVLMTLYSREETVSVVRHWRIPRRDFNRCLFLTDHSLQSTLVDIGNRLQCYRNRIRNLTCLLRSFRSRVSQKKGRIESVYE